jgi:hypothetical protein
MPETKTPDPKRGTPPGSPSSASDPRTDSAGDRSHPQPRNGGTTSVRRTRTGAAARVGQLGEGTHPGPVDGRLAPNRTARCLARCGSGPMGPPLVRGKAGWRNGDRRHGGGGSSSNLSSDSPSPEKAQTLSAARSGPAAWSSFPGWTNPQVGGFITLVMNPPITFRPWSWNRPAAGPDMAPEAASPEVGGFITLVRGVHHARTAWTSAALAQMEGTTTPPATRTPSPLPPRTPAAPTAAERRRECRFVPRDARRRPSIGRWESDTSCPQRRDGLDGFSAGVARQCHNRVATMAPVPTAKKMSEPVGLTLQSPSAPIVQAHKAEGAGSKIGDQYY